MHNNLIKTYSKNFEIINYNISLYLTYIIKLSNFLSFLKQFEKKIID